MMTIPGKEDQQNLGVQVGGADEQHKEENYSGQGPQRWTLDQWKSVFWSDESKFEIFGSISL